jgi:hypothetical protein
MSNSRSEPDANQIAHRVVQETIDKHSAPLPGDLEAAWDVWSRAIQNVDARGMELLRAAFEAGWEARKDSSRGLCTETPTCINTLEAAQKPKP